MPNYQTIETHEYVDCTTGEIKSIETKKRYTRKLDVKEFYITFCELVQNIYSIKSAKTLFLLTELCCRANYDTGRIDLTTKVRKEISEKIQLGLSNFSKHIRILLDLGVITGSGGTYYINPEIFWKGSLQKRQELLDKGYEFYAEFGFRKPE